jgi:hypothetical protein
VAVRRQQDFANQKLEKRMQNRTAAVRLRYDYRTVVMLLVYCRP